VGRSHCVAPFERVLIFQHYTIPNSIFSADDFGHARSGNKNLNGFNGSVPMIRGDNEADRGRVSVLRNWVQFGADGNHVYKRFEQSWASAIVHSPYGYGQLNLSIIIDRIFDSANFNIRYDHMGPLGIHQTVGGFFCGLSSFFSGDEQIIGGFFEREREPSNGDGGGCGNKPFVVLNQKYEPSKDPISERLGQAIIFFGTLG